MLTYLTFTIASSAEVGLFAQTFVALLGWRIAFQFVVPAVAIVLLGYTLYANVYPVPATPYDVFPYLVVAWIAVGVLISFLRPARMR
ncbi:MAG: hypothetical protein ACR2KG_03320 [Nocardioidaceae bacterium]